MSAASHILHHAIEAAVEELEPQLLPLFARGKGAAQLPQAPTRRTQMALKMLVALTRFFPAEHRVCQAGRELELLWPPLVLEPRGAAAGRLLNHYFRLRQDLLAAPERALRQGMCDQLRATLDAVQAGAGEESIAGCECRMRQLAAFLHEPGVQAEQLAGLRPLARLCLWQQALERSLLSLQLQDLPEPNAPDPLLLPDMLALLDRCTALCRASDWTLDYFCRSQLARCLWQLRGIARFCAAQAMAQRFDALDDECLDLHLAGNAPPPGAMQQWLVRLFAVVHDRGTVQPPPAESPRLPEVAQRAVYDQELAQYRRQLQAELQNELARARSAGAAEADAHAVRISAPLITLLYKLTWVFAAAEQQDWARFCHCAYRVALQFWRIRRPVTPQVQARLLELARKPGTPTPASVLRQWRWHLLQDWPAWTDDGSRPIALRHDTDGVVALAAVPDLLSGSFTTLVQAGRLTNLPAAEACRPWFQVLVQDLSSQLLQELALLEKGAAAMKVWPLERLCTLLIAVYETYLRAEPELPAALLQDAHRQLVRMLDQAAAWHEVETADAVVAALEAWLQERAAPGSACREPRGGAQREGEDCEAALRAQLLSCLGTLACVLERPVRLQLDTGKLQLDAARLLQVLDCLRPLIKFMLLDQSVDARTRTAMHKPRVSTLAVTLRATSATLAVTVGEDSHEDPLAPAELQRLQRRLPKAAGPLVCESRAGYGRSFTFTLPQH